MPRKELKFWRRRREDTKDEVQESCTALSQHHVCAISWPDYQLRQSIIQMQHLQGAEDLPESLGIFNYRGLL